jgi:hypothetical protein
MFDVFLEIRIAERYQLCERLGVGTFGLVYHHVFRTRSRGAGLGSRQGFLRGDLEVALGAIRAKTDTQRRRKRRPGHISSKYPSRLA